MALEGMLRLVVATGVFCGLAAPVFAAEPPPFADRRALLAKIAARKAPSPTAGPDGGRTPVLIGRVTVNNPDQTEADAQNTSAVIDVGGGALVAAFRDERQYDALKLTGYAYSSNNGLTWTDVSPLPDTAGHNFGFPVLAVAKPATAVYLADSSVTTPVINVFKSTDKGRTFPTSVAAITGANADDFVDYPSIAVDRFGGARTGTVYVCASVSVHGTLDQTSVTFARSTDSGASFTQGGGAVISPGGFGCFVTVSPNHYVSVFYFRGDNPGGVDGDNKLYVRRSTNGGDSFTPERVVADLATTSLMGRIYTPDGREVATYPQVAVNPDPALPTMVVTYNDIDPAHPELGSEIYYVSSSNNGVSWSTPAKVNDDTAVDQYLPSVAFAGDGSGRLMFAYSSRSQDPADLRTQRRGRFATLTATQTLDFAPQSFQLGPNVIEVKNGAAALGNSFRDGLAGGATAFSTTWTDDRLSDAAHAHQSDIRFAQIAAAPTTADLSIGIVPTATSVQRGDVVNFTVSASSAGGAANDVVVNVVPTGLSVVSAAGSGATCSLIDGQAHCLLGTIADGDAKPLQIAAVATGATSGRIRAYASTSSQDATPASNAKTQVVSIANGGVTQTYTSGSLSLAIPDSGSTLVPIDVADAGSVISVRAFVRLDHTYDGDLRLTLIGPDGVSVPLATGVGGSGDNYGTGPNSCSGQATTFVDSAATAIGDGAPPFSGSFRPDSPLAAFAGQPADGQWKLLVTDGAAGDTGTIGCVRLVIQRR